MLANFIIWLAKKRPYNKGHLFHRDGTVYMGRFSIIESSHFQVRVHHLATRDWDRHHHDHPRPFISVVLKGWYWESRPIKREPCFNGEHETSFRRLRKAGSIAYRRATDRHTIIEVREQTWTLFITLPRVQWWGFYTPAGKIFHKDYSSVHNMEERHGDLT